MAKKQYLSYQVNVPDRALAESLAAQYPDGVTRAPYNPVGPAGMAVEAANLMAEAGLTVPNPLPVLAYGTPVTSPSLTSLWFDSSNSFPRDVATFSIDAPAAGANPDTTPAPDDGDDTTAPDIPDAILRAPMPTRMHLDGMELSGGGEAPVFSGSGDDSKSAAGATLFEGVGFAARQRSTTLADRSYQHPFQLNHKVWDRFYFRVRRYPTAAPFEIFRITSQASSGSGARVYVTQGGQYAVYTATGSGETLVGTFGAVPLNTRLRVDVFGYVGDDGAGQVQCVMYFCVNGQLIANTTHLSTGLLVNGVYGETYLGHPYGTLTGADVDFDDWRISSLPNDKDFKLAEYNPASTYIAGDRVKWTGSMPSTKTEIRRTAWVKPVLGFEVFQAIAGVAPNTPPRTGIQMNTVAWVRLVDSPDFSNGMRIVPASPKSAAAIANWAPPDWRAVGQLWTNSDTSNGVASTTALADLQLVTDATDRLPEIPGVLGWASIQVGVRATHGTALGKVGYKIGGAAPVLTAIPNSGAFQSALYAPVGLTDPAAISALEVHYQKGNDGTSARVTMLAAVVELIGLFAPEDRPKIWDPDANNHVGAWVDSVAEVPPQPIGTHSAPWHNTPWFRTSFPPLSPVMMKGATYVGATNGLTLTFKQPPAFIWIRPTTGTTPGAKWFSGASALGAMKNDQGLGFIMIPRVERDRTFVPASPTDDQQMQFLVHIGGPQTNINANGTTYQYVAFFDPGARFCLTGAARVSDVVLPASVALERQAFVPEFGFFHRGIVGNNSSNQMWGKGTGHAAAGATDLNTVAETANAVTFGLGTLTLASGFIPASTPYDQISYALFRRSDGNDDPNEAKLMQMGSYDGDGAASRSISSGAGTGLRPFWGIVIPHNAAQPHYRDPSHTGTTSQQFTGAAQASTGISAGLPDGFTVGTALNANGVRYSWLMFMGSATAGNGGWSGNGEFTPVASDSPVDPVFPEPAGIVSDDTATTVKNRAVTIDVLANDEGGGEDLTITSVTLPAHGSVQVSAGQVVYTPEAEFVGTDTFTYSATDGDDDGTATVTVTVTATEGTILPEEPDLDPSTPLPGTTKFCLDFTTRIVNRALSRIGQSKQVTNLATGTSVEAMQARLHIKEDVETVLRDFPWPFATRYAELVLVDGSEDDPVNTDWTYSYRAPADMLMARRIVGQAGEKRAYDPDPPTFAIGSDAGGPIIYADVALDEEPVVLEYTVRMSCPAYQGDALFRNALTWRHAASLAMPIARDSKKQEFCLAMYKDALKDAEVPAANEGQKEKDGDASWITERN